MMKTPYTTAGLAVDRYSPPAQSGRIARQDGQPRRMKPLMRKYEVAHLTSPFSNDIADFNRIAPATAVFEECFAAFGRGALIQTQKGKVAVEDLLPGDMIETQSSGLQKLEWIGNMSVVPETRELRPEMSMLTRFTGDSIGYGRPSLDVVLGPSARLLHKVNGVRTLTGSDAAMVPARDFVDGEQVIELRPVSAVRVYHLGFANHEVLSVNGLSVESMHPGPAHLLGLRHELLAVFMSLFPHKTRLSDFGDLRHPRIRLRDLDLFAVA